MPTISGRFCQTKQHGLKILVGKISKNFKVRLAVSEQQQHSGSFLSVIWLSQGQLWAVDGDWASRDGYQSLRRELPMNALCHCVTL